MKNDYCHISVVLDRSGSMASTAKDVIGGFNTLLTDQKKVDGKATMTLAQFDDYYEVLQNFADLAGVPDLSTRTFVPRGSTALLDAMGKTLQSVKERIDAMASDEQPSRVLFVFITDGGENASTQFTRARVFEMIEDLKKSSEDRDSIKWDFVFIGANQDAISEGGSLGFSRSASLTYSATSAGSTMAFDSLSRGITSYRCATESANYSFSEDDRKAQDEIINPILNIDLSTTSDKK